MGGTAQWRQPISNKQWNVGRSTSTPYRLACGQNRSNHAGNGRDCHTSKIAVQISFRHIKMVAQPLEPLRGTLCIRRCLAAGAASHGYRPVTGSYSLRPQRDTE